MARAWLRSEPLLLGWCEGPRKEADQGCRVTGVALHPTCRWESHGTEALGNLHQGTQLSGQPCSLNLATPLQVPRSEAAARRVLSLGLSFLIWSVGLLILRRHRIGA